MSFKKSSVDKDFEQLVNLVKESQGKKKNQYKDPNWFNNLVKKVKKDAKSKRR